MAVNSSLPDGRREILSLILLSFLGMRLPFPLVFLYILFYFAALAKAGLRPGAFIKQMKGILLLLFFTSLMAGLINFLSGREKSLTELCRQVFLSKSGELFIRLFLLLQAAALLVRRLSLREIRQTVTWGASFIPGLPAEKTGLVFSLAISSIPYLLAFNGEIRTAQKIRGAEQIRNPLKRIAAPLFPLILGTLIRSQNMGDALLARGYGLSDEEEAETGGNFRRKKLLRKELLRPWNNRDTALLLGRLALMTAPPVLWMLVK